MMVLAVFNNRTQALQYSRLLKGIGVSVRIINTPREITNSCGLSIMFSYKDLNKARIIINSNRLVAFRGFYIKKEMGFNIVYEKTN